MGVEEEVILVSTGAAPRVIRFSEVVIEYCDHRLMGHQQLRQAQGSETWSTLEKEPCCTSA